MGILSWILFGLVVGFIAKLLTPGRDPGGFIVTILLGIAGALIGGFLGRSMGLYGPSPSAGWLMSILGADQNIVADLREQSGLAPIEAIVLGDGSQQLVLRLAANRTCVRTAAEITNLPSASRTVSLGNQQLSALLGEELRIRARDLAFERAIAASRNVS